MREEESTTCKLLVLLRTSSHPNSNPAVTLPAERVRFSLCPESCDSFCVCHTRWWITCWHNNASPTLLFLLLFPLRVTPATPSLNLKPMNPLALCPPAASTRLVLSLRELQRLLGVASARPNVTGVIQLLMYVIGANSFLLWGRSARGMLLVLLTFF